MASEHTINLDSTTPWKRATSLGSAVRLVCRVLSVSVGWEGPNRVRWPGMLDWVWRPVPTELICPRPSCLTGVVVSQPSVGREGTGRLAKSPCPLSQFFLRTSVSRLTYVKENGLVDTGLCTPAESACYLGNQDGVGLLRQGTNWFTQRSKHAFVGFGLLQRRPTPPQQPGLGWLGFKGHRIRGPLWALPCQCLARLIWNKGPPVVEAIRRSACNQQVSHHCGFESGTWQSFIPHEKGSSLLCVRAVRHDGLIHLF